MANVYLVVGLFLVRKPGSKPSTDNLKLVVGALNAKPVGVILAVVLGLIVATLLTQSLEFATVRLLEGYWGGSVWSAWPTRTGIAGQALRQRLLLHRASKLERRAFVAAAPAVRRELGGDRQLALAVDSLGRGWPAPDDSESVIERADAYLREKSWMKYSPAHLRHRLLAVDGRLRSFPGPSRLMPTRLGNTLRVAETAIRGDVAGTRMRGYVVRHLAEIEPALLEQLDMYRNRLDMYAVMTPLCVGLAVVDAICLPRTIPAELARVFSGAFVLLSWLSYRGAVSTAVDYGEALVTVSTAVEKAGRGVSRRRVP
jgi:hypothetical protein